MITAGIALMAVMMGGMLFMHLGSRGHSGHGGAHEPPAVAPASTTPSDAPHDHHLGEKVTP